MHKDNISRYTKCECSAHLLEVRGSKPVFGREFEEDIEICIWDNDISNRGLWSRLKYAWEIIWNGTLYADWLLLKPASARQLIKDIEEVVDFTKISRENK